MALRISSGSNLFATDVIHLVTAWISNCPVLLTSDEFFLKEGNEVLENEGVRALKICRSKDLEKTLGMMGFETQSLASTERHYIEIYKDMGIYKDGISYVAEGATGEHTQSSNLKGLKIKIDILKGKKG